MSDGFDEGELLGVQPSVDAVARDKARAEIAQRLFGAPSEPHRMGRFVILGRLGRGGMGVVYSAYDPVLDRRVALKLLRPGPRGDVERMRARLQREAQALARLSHPNVVPVYDVGILGDDVFIVMEFVVGQTLRAWAPGRPWHEVLAAYLQAARGLSAAHAVGLVHRDIKPDNIMVGEDGRVRVLDFGLVRGYEPEPDVQPAGNRAATSPPAAGVGIDTVMGALDTMPLTPGDAAPYAGGAATVEVAGQGRARERLTATEAIMGTPAYMAPEQLRGSGVGPHSDQFGFCAALYEGLYGEHAVATRDLAALVDEAHALRVITPENRDATFPGPREPPASSPLPPALWPIVRRGLSADAARRWPSMDALIDALSAVLADYDHTLADPGVHRFQRLTLAAVGSIGLLALLGLIYANARGMTAEMYTPGATLMVNLIMFLTGGAFLVVARMRWKTVEYLRRFIEVFVVYQGGIVLNDIVGIWLGRPLYQTVLADLVMMGAVFALASLMFARWLAWLLIMNLATLALCLLVPAHYLELTLTSGFLSTLVVLLAWNRRKRQLGALPPAPPRAGETRAGHPV